MLKGVIWGNVYSILIDTPNYNGLDVYLEVDLDIMPHIRDWDKVIYKEYCGSLMPFVRIDYNRKSKKEKFKWAPITTVLRQIHRDMGDATSQLRRITQPEIKLIPHPYKKKKHIPILTGTVFDFTRKNLTAHNGATPTPRNFTYEDQCREFRNITKTTGFRYQNTARHIKFVFEDKEPQGVDFKSSIRTAPQPTKSPDISPTPTIQPGDQI